MKTEQAQLIGQKERNRQKTVDRIVGKHKKNRMGIRRIVRSIKKGAERRKEKNGSGITKEKELKEEDCVCSTVSLLLRFG